MKNKVEFLLGVLILTFMFTACGGDNEKEDDSAVANRELLGSWSIVSYKATVTPIGNTGAISLIEDYVEQQVTNVLGIYTFDEEGVLTYKNENGVVVEKYTYKTYDNLIVLEGIAESEGKKLIFGYTVKDKSLELIRDYNDSSIAHIISILDITTISSKDIQSLTLTYNLKKK